MPAQKEKERGVIDLLVILGIAVLLGAIPLIQKFGVSQRQEGRGRAGSSAASCPGNFMEDSVYSECCGCKKAREVRKCVKESSSDYYTRSDCVNDDSTCTRVCPPPTVTPQPPPPTNCTVGNCCGCHTKYGSNCECDIPANTCTSGCASPPTSTPMPISGWSGPTACKRGSGSNCSDYGIASDLGFTQAKWCECCLGCLGPTHSTCARCLPTATPADGCLTPEDCAAAGRCNLTCFGSPRRCGWTACVPTSTQTPIPPPPTNTPVPDCGDICSSSSQCASWCGNSAYQCRGGNCSIPPTSTPTTKPPTSTPTPVCDYYSLNTCTGACGTSSCPHVGSCYSCPALVPPTSTPTRPPPTNTPTRPPPTNTPRPTSTLIPTPLAYCGSSVGYQSLGGKCYNCQFPSQSNPPEVNSSYCAPTSTPRPTATLIPLATATPNLAYHCDGDVLRQGQMEIDTCTYGCDTVLRKCKDKPADCGTYLNGSYRCSTSSTTKYEICENGSWIVRSCPTGKECYDGRCQDPRPTATPTTIPTATPPVCHCCGLLERCNGTNYGRQNCSLLQSCCASCGSEPTPTPITSSGLTPTPASGFAGLIGSPTPRPNTRGVHCDGSNLMDGSQLIDSCTYGCNSTSLSCDPIPANLACTSGTRCNNGLVQHCDTQAGTWVNDKRCENACNPDGSASCKPLECTVGEIKCLSAYYSGTCRGDNWEREYCQNGCYSGACINPFMATTSTSNNSTIQVTQPLGGTTSDIYQQLGNIPIGTTEDEEAFYQLTGGLLVGSFAAPLGIAGAGGSAVAAIYRSASYLMGVGGALQVGTDAYQRITGQSSSFINAMTDVGRRAGNTGVGIASSLMAGQVIAQVGANLLTKVADNLIGSTQYTGMYNPEEAVQVNNMLAQDQFNRDYISLYKGIHNPVQGDFILPGYLNTNPNPRTVDPVTGEVLTTYRAGAGGTYSDNPVAINYAHSVFARTDISQAQSWSPDIETARMYAKGGYIAQVIMPRQDVVDLPSLINQDIFNVDIAQSAFLNLYDRPPTGPEIEIMKTNIANILKRQEFLIIGKVPVADWTSQEGFQIGTARILR